MDDSTNKDRKKDPGSDDELDLAALEDWDIGTDEDPFGGSEQNTKRKPDSPTKNFVVGLAKGAMSSGKAEVGEIINREFPSVSSIAGDVKDTYQEFADLKAEIGKQVAPMAASLENSARKLLPKAKSYIPTALYEKIEKKLAERAKARADAEYKAPSKAEIQAATIADELAAIFGQQNQIDQQKRLAEKQSELVDQAIGAQRHKETTISLHHIYDSLRSTELFHQTTMTAYMKKTLELKYQHLFVAQDTFTLLDQMGKKFEAYYKSIVHNTSLPDMIKVQMGDYHRKSRTERWGRRMDEFLTGAKKKVFEKLKGKAKELIGQGGFLVDQISQGADMAEMGESFGDLGGEQKKPGKAGLVGRGLGMLLGKLGLGPAVQAGMEKIKPFTEDFDNAAGDLKAGAMLNLAKLRRSWTTQTDSRWKQIIGEFLPDYEKSSTGTNLLLDKANEATAFDNMTRQSIVEIIPGFLGKIHQSIEKLRLGTEDVGEQVYNVYSRKFTDVETLKLDAGEYMYGTADSRAEALSGALATLQAGTARNTPDVKAEDATKGYEKDINRVFMNHAVHVEFFDPQAIREFLVDPESVGESSYIRAITRGLEHDPREVLKIIHDSIFDKNGDMDKRVVADINKSLMSMRKLDGYKSELPKMMEVYGYRDKFSDEFDSRTKAALKKAAEAGDKEAEARLKAGTGLMSDTNTINLDRIADDAGNMDYETEELSDDEIKKKRDEKIEKLRKSDYVRAQEASWADALKLGKVAEFGTKVAGGAANLWAKVKGFGKDEFEQEWDKGLMAAKEFAARMQTKGEQFAEGFSKKYDHVRDIVTGLDENGKPIYAEPPAGAAKPEEAAAPTEGEAPAPTEEVPPAEGEVPAEGPTLKEKAATALTSTKKVIGSFGDGARATINKMKNSKLAAKARETVKNLAASVAESEPGAPVQTNVTGFEDLTASTMLIAETLETNGGILREISEEIKKYAPRGPGGGPGPEGPESGGGGVVAGIAAGLADSDESSSSDTHSLLVDWKAQNSEEMGILFDTMATWRQEQLDALKVISDSIAAGGGPGGGEGGGGGGKKGFMGKAMGALGAGIKGVGKVYTRIYGSALEGLGTAAKGAFGFAGKVFDGAKSAAKWLTKVPDFVDIYRKGEEGGAPLVTARQQREDPGCSFKSTGERVMRSKDINEPIVDNRTGNLVITQEDLEAGLSMPDGKSVAGKIAGAVGKGAKTVLEGYFGIYGKAISAIGGVAKAAVGAVFGTKVEDYIDIYRKDEVGGGYKPILTRLKQKRDPGVVFKDGKRVEKSSDIHEPVYDPVSSEELISQDDIDHGLVDVNNKPVGSGMGGSGLLGKAIDVGKGLGKFLGKGALKGFDLYSYLYKGLFDLGVKGVKGVGKVVGSWLTKGGGGHDEEMFKVVKEIGENIVLIRDHLVGVKEDVTVIKEDTKKVEQNTEPEKHDVNDADGDGDVDGSYADQMQKKEKKEREALNLGDLHKDVDWSKKEGEGGGKDGEGGGLNFLGKMGKAALNKIINSKVGIAVIGFGKALFGKVGTLLKGLGGKLGVFTKALGGKLGGYAKLLGTKLGGFMKVFGGKLWTFTKILGGKLGTFAQSFGGKLGKFVGQFGGKLGNVLGKFGGKLGPLLGKAGGMLGKVGGIAGKALGGVGGKALGLVSKIPGVAGLAAKAGGLLGGAGAGGLGGMLGAAGPALAAAAPYVAGAAAVAGAAYLGYKALGIGGIIKGIKGNDNPLTEKEVEQGRKKLQYRVDKGMPGYDRILQEYEKAIAAQNWRRARELSGQEADGIIKSMWKESWIGKGTTAIWKGLVGNKDQEMTEEEIKKVHAKFDSIIAKGGDAANKAEKLKDKFDQYVADGNWKKAREIAGMEKRGLFGKLFQDSKGNVKWGRLAMTAAFGVTGYAVSWLFAKKDENEPMTEAEVKKEREYLQKLITQGNKTAEKVLEKFDEAVTEMNWKKARKIVGKEVKSNLAKAGNALKTTAKWWARINTLGLSMLFETSNETPLKDEEIKKFVSKMNYCISKGDKFAQKKLDQFEAAVAKQDWEKARKIAKMPHQMAITRAAKAVWAWAYGDNDKEMTEEEMEKFRNSMQRKIKMGNKSAERKLDAFEDAVGRQNWRKARAISETPDDGINQKIAKGIAKGVAGTWRFFFGGDKAEMSEDELAKARKLLQNAVDDGKKNAKKRQDMFEDFVADEKWDKARALVKMPYENALKRAGKAIGSFLFGGDNMKEMTPDEIDEFRSQCEARIADGNKRAEKILNEFNAAVAAERWDKARKISGTKDEGLWGSAKSAAKGVWNWITGNKDRKDCEEMREKLEEKAMDGDDTGIINAAIDQFSNLVRRRQFNEAMDLGEDILKMKPHELASKHKFNSEKFEKMKAQADELVEKIVKEEEENNGFLHPITEMKLASLRKRVKEHSDEWGDEFFEQSQTELSEIVNKPDLLPQGNRPDDDVYNRGQELIDTVNKVDDNRSWLGSPIIKTRLGSLRDEIKTSVTDWDHDKINEWYDRLGEIDEDYKDGRKGDPKDKENAERAKKLISDIDASIEKMKNDGKTAEVARLQMLKSKVEANATAWTEENLDAWYNELGEIDQSYAGEGGDQKAMDNNGEDPWSEYADFSGGETQEEVMKRTDEEMIKELEFRKKHGYSTDLKDGVWYTDDAQLMAEMGETPKAAEPATGGAALDVEEDKKKARRLANLQNKAFEARFGGEQLTDAEREEMARLQNGEEPDEEEQEGGAAATAEGEGEGEGSSWWQKLKTGAKIAAGVAIPALGASMLANKAASGVWGWLKSKFGKGEEQEEVEVKKAEGSEVEAEEEEEYIDCSRLGLSYKGSFGDYTYQAYIDNQPVPFLDWAASLPPTDKVDYTKSMAVFCGCIVRDFIKSYGGEEVIHACTWGDVRPDADHYFRDQIDERVKSSIRRQLFRGACMAIFTIWYVNIFGVTNGVAMIRGSRPYNTVTEELVEPIEMSDEEKEKLQAEAKKAEEEAEPTEEQTAETEEQEGEQAEAKEEESSSWWDKLKTAAKVAVGVAVPAVGVGMLASKVWSWFSSKDEEKQEEAEIKKAEGEEEQKEEEKSFVDCSKLEFELENLGDGDVGYKVIIDGEASTLDDLLASLPETDRIDPESDVPRKGFNRPLWLLGLVRDFAEKIGGDDNIATMKWSEFRELWKEFAMTKIDALEAEPATKLLLRGGVTAIGKVFYCNVFVTSPVAMIRHDRPYDPERQEECILNDATEDQKAQIKEAAAKATEEAEAAEEETQEEEGEAEATEEAAAEEQPAQEESSSWWDKLKTAAKVAVGVAIPPVGAAMLAAKGISAVWNWFKGKDEEAKQEEVEIKKGEGAEAGTSEEEGKEEETIDCSKLGLEFSGSFGDYRYKCFLDGEEAPFCDYVASLPKTEKVDPKDYPCVYAACLVRDYVKSIGGDQVVRTLPWSDFKYPCKEYYEDKIDEYNDNLEEGWNRLGKELSWWDRDKIKDFADAITVIWYVNAFGISNGMAIIRSNRALNTETGEYAQLEEMTPEEIEEAKRAENAEGEEESEDEEYLEDQEEEDEEGEGEQEEGEEPPVAEAVEENQDTSWWDKVKSALKTGLKVGAIAATAPISLPIIGAVKAGQAAFDWIKSKLSGDEEGGEKEEVEIKHAGEAEAEAETPEENVPDYESTPKVDCSKLRLNFSKVNNAVKYDIVLDGEEGTVDDFIASIPENVATVDWEWDNCVFCMGLIRDYVNTLTDENFVCTMKFSEFREEVFAFVNKRIEAYKIDPNKFDEFERKQLMSCLDTCARIWYVNAFGIDCGVAIIKGDKAYNPETQDVMELDDPSRYFEGEEEESGEEELEDALETPVDEDIEDEEELGEEGEEDEEDEEPEAEEEAAAEEPEDKSWWQKIKDQISGVADKVGGAVGAVVDKVTTPFRKLGGFFAGIFGGDDEEEEKEPEEVEIKHAEDSGEEEDNSKNVLEEAEKIDCRKLRIDFSTFMGDVKYEVYLDGEEGSLDDYIASLPETKQVDPRDWGMCFAMCLVRDYVEKKLGGEDGICHLAWSDFKEGVFDYNEDVLEQVAPEDGLSWFFRKELESYLTTACKLTYVNAFGLDTGLAIIRQNRAYDEETGRTCDLVEETEEEVEKKAEQEEDDESDLEEEAPEEEAEEEEEEEAEEDNSVWGKLKNLLPSKKLKAFNDKVVAIKDKIVKKVKDFFGIGGNEEQKEAEVSKAEGEEEYKELSPEARRKRIAELEKKEFEARFGGEGLTPDEEAELSRLRLEEPDEEEGAAVIPAAAEATAPEAEGNLSATEQVMEATVGESRPNNQPLEVSPAAKAAAAPVQEAVNGVKPKTFSKQGEHAVAVLKEAWKAKKALEAGDQNAMSAFNEWFDNYAKENKLPGGLKSSLMKDVERLWKSGPDSKDIMHKKHLTEAIRRYTEENKESTSEETEAATAEAPAETTSQPEVAKVDSNLLKQESKEPGAETPTPESLPEVDKSKVIQVQSSLLKPQEDEGPAEDLLPDVLRAQKFMPPPSADNKALQASQEHAADLMRQMESQNGQMQQLLKILGSIITANGMKIEGMEELTKVCGSKQPIVNNTTMLPAMPALPEPQGLDVRKMQG